MFAIIAANHYRSVGSSPLKIALPKLTNRHKPKTHNKKTIFGRKLDLVAPVCFQNQGIVENKIKNNTNDYCFKGTSRMGMELIRTDQIKKPYAELRKDWRLEERKWNEKP